MLAEGLMQTSFVAHRVPCDVCMAKSFWVEQCGSSSLRLSTGQQFKACTLVVCWTSADQPMYRVWQLLCQCYKGAS